MLNLCASEIFTVIDYSCFDINPKCFTMFCKQSFMQFHKLPNSYILNLLVKSVRFNIKRKLINFEQPFLGIDK